VNDGESIRAINCGILRAGNSICHLIYIDISIFSVRIGKVKQRLNEHKSEFQEADFD